PSRPSRGSPESSALAGGVVGRSVRESAGKYREIRATGDSVSLWEISMGAAGSDSALAIGVGARSERGRNMLPLGSAEQPVAAMTSPPASRIRIGVMATPSAAPRYTELGRSFRPPASRRSALFHRTSAVGSAVDSDNRRKPGRTRRESSL